MKKNKSSNVEAIKQKNNKCNRYGKIIYNSENKANKDGYIIHLTLFFWKRQLKRHPDILGRFYDTLDTVEYGTISSSIGNKKVRYTHCFSKKSPLDVVVYKFECKMYCIIHVMNLIGEVIALTRKRE